MTNRLDTDASLIALVKGSERYVIIFPDTRRADALRQLGRWAVEPELSFTWYDAATLSQRIRNQGDCDG